MSNDDSSVSGAGDAGSGGNDRVAAPTGAVGDSGAQTKNQPAQIPTQSNNGGSNNGSGATSGAGESGQIGRGGEGAVEKDKKRQRRPPTAAQTAARKKAAEERKRFRDRVNLIAAALEEEQERNVQQSSGSSQQPTSDQAQPGAPTAPTGGSTSTEGEHDLDQGGDDSAGDEMDMAANAFATPRVRSKRDMYFGQRVRRTRGLHRVADGFQQFLSGSVGDDSSVRLPSATAMRQQFNWARAPGTSLLDRMAVMNNRATAHSNMRRSVRLPKYMDGL